MCPESQVDESPGLSKAVAVRAVPRDAPQVNHLLHVPRCPLRVSNSPCSSGSNSSFLSARIGWPRDTPCIATQVTRSLQTSSQYLPPRRQARPLGLRGRRLRGRWHLRRLRGKGRQPDTWRRGLRAQRRWERHRNGSRGLHIPCHPLDVPAHLFP